LIQGKWLTEITNSDCAMSMPPPNLDGAANESFLCHPGVVFNLSTGKQSPKPCCSEIAAFFSVMLTVFNAFSKVFLHV
jgi:hypothetical protein